MNGSPPHVWGNPNGITTTPAIGRFTPTRVGKSCQQRVILRLVAVHPHTCGEIRQIRTSPRIPTRFTPTRVGKSFGMDCQICAMTVHPHTCGEIRRGVRVDPRVFGSPPHVWGNRHLKMKTNCPVRFTPTRVGKSTRPQARRTNPAVHPHTCGEIASVHQPILVVSGSPPHVWGNLSLRGSAHRAQSVHPHTCGEIFLVF